MRALVFFGHGGPEVLTVQESWPRPTAGPGEVVVRIAACALNHLDIFVRRGMPGKKTDLPHISGGDGSGVVEAVGAGLTSWAPGDRVLIDPAVAHGALGEDTQGLLCEYASVPVENLIPLPPEVAFEAAAALPIAYGTAWRMLMERAAVRRGEAVLVLGASGGVGTACVQIAKLAGARVFAAASTKAKLELLSALGADELIDTSSADWGRDVWQRSGKRGVDLVVDYSGKDTWPTSIRSLAKGGRIVTCGATSGFEAVTDLRYVWTREQTIIGSDGWTRDGLIRLIELVRRGEIEPVIDRVVPLEKVAEAEEALERREVFGKIVVTP